MTAERRISIGGGGLVARKMQCLVTWLLFKMKLRNNVWGFIHECDFTKSLQFHKQLEASNRLCENFFVIRNIKRKFQMNFHPCIKADNPKIMHSWRQNLNTIMPYLNTSLFVYHGFSLSSICQCNNISTQQFKSIRGNEHTTLLLFAAIPIFPFQIRFRHHSKNSKLLSRKIWILSTHINFSSSFTTTSCVTEICSVCNSKRLITSHILFCYLFNFSSLCSFFLVFFSMLHVSLRTRLLMSHVASFFL